MILIKGRPLRRKTKFYPFLIVFLILFSKKQGYLSTIIPERFALQELEKGGGLLYLRYLHGPQVSIIFSDTDIFSET